MEIRQVSDSLFTITANAELQKGWHVYAKQDAASGIEPLNITWTNENIQAVGSPILKNQLIAYKDPLFDNCSFLVAVGNIQLSQDVIIRGQVPGSFKVLVHGFASNDKEFFPVNETIAIPISGRSTTNNEAQILLPGLNINKPEATCGSGTNVSGDANLLNIFLLGLIGGLLALLTPCVFPMIPVTVSFFTNKAATRKIALRNGLLYGIFILSIYGLAGLPFRFIHNIDPQILNTISTNAVVNLVFFFVFILFSLSFFGLFEISLPSAFSNSAGNKSGIGNASGIFFMALTLAIVSFSCTGPILGTLLVSSLSGNAGAWQLTTGMLGFGAALAFPFALFAIFPQWLKQLPKSGGWLDTVKKVLAFIELALAFKFLSNADLVKHWGILKRETFIGIWMIIALMLALYLFGFFDKTKKTTININGSLPGRGNKLNSRFFLLRLMLGMFALLVAGFLFPAILPGGKTLVPSISGYAPPLSYSLYVENKENMRPDVVNDYEQAVKLSREKNKPILVDFTGWACVNCRRMEENVWTKPEIRNLISENYILVSLYVDDRAKLPAGKQFSYRQSDGSEKEIQTLGDKWSTFQAENFKQVTQPLYVLLSPEGKLLNNPVGFTPNETEYEQWLQCGLKAYRKTVALALRD